MKTNQIKVSFTVDCPIENVGELKRFVDSHIDYIVDLESNKDIIKNIYGASVINLDDDFDNRAKFSGIMDLILEIQNNEPSDEELEGNPKLEEVYAEIHNLRQALENIGY